MVAERVNEAKDHIVISDDPDYDRLIKGMIRAFYEILEWKPELIDDEEFDEVPTRDTGTQSSY